MGYNTVSLQHPSLTLQDFGVKEISSWDILIHLNNTIQGRFFVHYFFVIKCLLWLFVVVISEVNSGRIRLVDCSGCCIKTLRPADVKHYSASWVQLIVRNMIASDWDSLRVLSSCHLHTDVSYFGTNKTMLLVFFWRTIIVRAANEKTETKT